MSLVTRTGLFSILMLFAPLAVAGPSVEGLIGLLIWLIVVGLIFYLAWWLLGYIGLPDPFNKVARVIIGLVAFLILLYLLLGMLGPIPALR